MWCLGHTTRLCVSLKRIECGRFARTYIHIEKTLASSRINVSMYHKVVFILPPTIRHTNIYKAEKSFSGLCILLYRNEYRGTALNREKYNSDLDCNEGMVCTSPTALELFHCKRLNLN